MTNSQVCGEANSLLPARKCKFTKLFKFKYEFVQRTGTALVYVAFTVVTYVECEQNQSTAQDHNLKQSKK